MVVDPLIDFDTNPMFSVETAANNNQYYGVNSNNFSQSSCSFQVNLNGSASVSDRNFLLSCPVAIAFTGTLTGSTTTLLNANLDGFASIPLGKAMASLTVTIGTQQVTILPSDMIRCFERYSPMLRKYLDNSQSPVMPDNSQNYVDLVGSQRNPLNTFNFGVDQIQSRGAFPMTIVSNVANSGTASITATLTEPLFISPLLQNFTRKCGFSHLTNIAINISWNSGNLLSRMWRHISPPTNFSTLTSVAVTFPSAPTLYIVQSLPSLLMPVPPVVTLPYDEIVSYPTAAQSAPAYGVTAQATSQTLQLSRIPKEAYLYVTDSNGNANFNWTIPDRFYPIQQVTCVFNTQTLLSGATIYDLYKINCTNDSNQTWVDYNGLAIGGSTYGLIGTSGSPLCLKFGKDISLPSESWAVGTNVKANIQFQVTFINNNPTALAGGWQVVLYVIVVYAGAINLYGQNNSLIVIAPLSESDVEHAQKLDRRIHYDIVRDQTLNGGSFFSGVKNFIQDKAIPFLKSVRNHPLYNTVSGIAKNYARKSGNPYLKTAADVADVVGLGDGVTGGGRRRRGRPSKKHAKGGAQATHAMLKHALLGRGEEGGDLEGAGEMSQGSKPTKRGRPAKVAQREDDDMDSLASAFDEFGE
jgi:hypothetical protein